MLARPEEDESGAQLRLVTGGGGFAHAGEQTSPAFRIADVRPRDCRAVDERVAERHVPRAQRLNLAVEVLAASLEPRVAIGHPGERRERLGRAPHACRPRDQLPETLDVRSARRPLGEVLAERVV